MLHPARNHGLHGPHSWHAAWVKLPSYSSPPRGSISCIHYYAKIVYPSFLINPTLTFLCTSMLLPPLLLFTYIPLLSPILYPRSTWLPYGLSTRRFLDKDTCRFRVILRQHFWETGTCGFHQ